MRSGGCGDWGCHLVCRRMIGSLHWCHCWYTTALSVLRSTLFAFFCPSLLTAFHRNPQPPRRNNKLVTTKSAPPCLVSNT